LRADVRTCVRTRPLTPIIVTVENRTRVGLGQSSKAIDTTNDMSAGIIAIRRMMVPDADLNNVQSHSQPRGSYKKCLPTKQERAQHVLFADVQRQGHSNQHSECDCQPVQPSSLGRRSVWINAGQARWCILVTNGCAGGGVNCVYRSPKFCQRPLLCILDVQRKDRVEVSVIRLTTKVVN
jgi:hypothetical protein